MIAQVIISHIINFTTNNICFFSEFVIFPSYN